MAVAIHHIGSNAAQIGRPDGPAPTTRHPMAYVPCGRHAAAAKNFFFIALPNQKIK
jgi:hypothetical protein